MRPERMKKNRKNKKKKLVQEAAVGLRSKKALRDPRERRKIEKIRRKSRSRKPPRVLGAEML